MSFVIRSVGTAALAFALTGCAATGNPRDPLEGFNRAMFSFNDAIDRAALKPAATAYQSNVPSFMQTGIGNFFGNIGDLWSSVNNLLQGKLADGLSDFMRVALNSSFGLGGVLDIASEAGMPKHKEDFGQTLGTWGVAPGPYVVLPLLGSSTMRDTLALPVDTWGDLWSHKYPVRWRNAGTVVRLVDQRAAVLNVSSLIEEAALDRYEFVRDAYLQRRESKIHDDGEMPKKPTLDDSGTNQLSPQSQRSPAPALPSMEPGAESVAKVDRIDGVNPN